MSQQSKPREFLGTTDDHGHFIPLSQVESWMKDAWPNAVHVVEKSALDEAQAKLAVAVEALKFYADKDNHAIRRGGESDTRMRLDKGATAREALKDVGEEA